MRQATYEVSETTQRMFYQVAGQTIMVEAQDGWSARIVKEMFIGWYLNPVTESPEALISPAIVIVEVALDPGNSARLAKLRDCRRRCVCWRG